MIIKWIYGDMAVFYFKWCLDIHFLMGKTNLIKFIRLIKYWAHLQIN
jgi:hypothetical protein